MVNDTWKLRSSWIRDGYKVPIAILMHLPNTFGFGLVKRGKVPC